MLHTLGRRLCEPATPPLCPDPEGTGQHCGAEVQGEDKGSWRPESTCCGGWAWYLPPQVNQATLWAAISHLTEPAETTTRLGAHTAHDAIQASILRQRHETGETWALETDCSHFTWAPSPQLHDPGKLTQPLVPQRPPLKSGENDSSQRCREEQMSKHAESLRTSWRRERVP